MAKKKLQKETKVKPEVEYILTVTYSGYDTDKDKKIEKAVGRPLGGAGCGFGERDINFYFKQEKAAKKALTRLKKSKIRVKKELNKVTWHDEGSDYEPIA